ncbi:MAG: hypothetical protein QG656_1969, partial [Candidatus Hydrogenedentes bacterium]|nr:hypothetical protein [Candidatus Hydrogenedentota bacterium]
GTLTNWRRMGFDANDPEREPGVWLSTVVNNRADRIARSRVFASILAADVYADGHVIIGTNVTGMMGYIAEAWASVLRGITLWPEMDDHRIPNPRETAARLAKLHRIPPSGEAVQARLKAMLDGLDASTDHGDLSGLWDDPEELGRQLASVPFSRYRDEILKWVERDRKVLVEYQSVLSRLEGVSRPDHAIDEAFRGVLGKWFESKLVVVEDPYASGDEVVKRVAESAPPGLLNRVMGMQNIKGTGFGFVLCWQAWERCHRACAQLQSDDPPTVEEGLRTLAAFQEYGLLSEMHAIETIDAVGQSPVAQNERFQAELAVIKSNIEGAMERVRQELSVVRRSGWLIHLVEAIEAFMDAGDGVRRRKQADRIYRDMVQQRIGYDRAARELQALHHREKGGWLLASILRWHAQLLGRPVVRDPQED